MSMAASIESRVPLLDYRIVEFANRMPSNYKMNSFQTKVIFKKVAERFLPGTIINRKKSGFGVPLGKWFQEKTGMGELVENVFCNQENGNIFSKTRLNSIFAEHRAGKHDHSEFLWAAINFLMWKNAFNVL